MIPSKHDYEVDFLTEEMTNLIRKDLSAIQDDTLDDPRQRPRKEYNHPQDSVMALIYSLVAIKQKTEWNWVRV